MPDAGAIRAAATRIAPFIARTPVRRSQALDARAGARLVFKCEHRQATGAFKLRGAVNAVWSLTDEQARRGVATHSSGNHGAALAHAARTRGMACTVVMPEDAVPAKVANVRRHGATVAFCEPSQKGRERRLAALVADTGATVIPPYDDERVIAGQGTCALALFDQAPELDALVVPVGGGGLISGCGIVAAAREPPVAVWGAEPDGAADARLSLAAGRRVTDITPETVCDGLRAIISERTFRGLRETARGVMAVDDADTLAAVGLIRRELGQTVEPSSAIALAAILGHRERFAGRRVGVILPGGNAGTGTSEG